MLSIHDVDWILVYAEASIGTDNTTVIKSNLIEADDNRRYSCCVRIL